jgi:hypothetical protein
MIVVLSGVALAAVINYVVVGGIGGDIAFNVGRFVLCLVAGWVIVAPGRGSMWAAAFVGPFVLLIDHVLLKGGYFVLAHFFWPDLVQGEGLLAARGVVVSFAMFVPLAGAFSFAGGFLGGRNKSKGSASF